MIRVLVFGQPYWGSHIARALNAHAHDMRATYIPQRGYPRLFARPPRSEPVVIMRVGYRTGASTPRGRLFDAFWSLLRRALPEAVPCHYWLGSDVLYTLEESQAGTLRRAALSSTKDDLHLAGAPWLAIELESVGIHATTAPIPERSRPPLVAPSLPSEFSVLTYLPARRFEFYGGDVILEAARRLPDVRFDVVGATGAPDRQSPPNVRWHGWVTDMPRYYAETTVVVRIPRHDGLGGTLVESLFNARHVITTMDLPFVRRVWPATPDALVAALRELHDAHVGGELSPNLAGRAHALQEFDEGREVEHLMTLLRARI